MLGYSRQAYYQQKKQSEKKSLQHDLLINEVLKIRKIQKRLGGRKLFHKLERFIQEHHISIGRDAFFDLLSERKLLTMSRPRLMQRTIYQLITRLRTRMTAGRWVMQYKTKACRSCPVRIKCTRSKNGRLIERSIYAENYERNRTNTEEKEQLYKRRQAIVEHPFGTIKRQWGFSYILTKQGIDRASADVGFMFIAYNFRRIGNILTHDQLKGYLRILVSLFLIVSAFFRGKINQFETSVFQEIICTSEKRLSLKSP